MFSQRRLPSPLHFFLPSQEPVVTSGTHSRSLPLTAIVLPLAFVFPYLITIVFNTDCYFTLKHYLFPPHFRHALASKRCRRKTPLLGQNFCVGSLTIWDKFIHPLLYHGLSVRESRGYYNDSVLIIIFLSSGSFLSPNQFSFLFLCCTRVQLYTPPLLLESSLLQTQLLLPSFCNENYCHSSTSSTPPKSRWQTSTFTHVHCFQPILPYR